MVIDAAETTRRPKQTERAARVARIARASTSIAVDQAPVPDAEDRRRRMPPRNAKTNAMNNVANEASIEQMTWLIENESASIPKRTIEEMIELTRMNLDLAKRITLVNGRVNVPIDARCSGCLRIVIGRRSIGTTLIRHMIMIMFMMNIIQMINEYVRVIVALGY